MVYAIEEPVYSVLESNDRFEVRDYQPIIMVEVVVDASFEAAGNQAFGKLFRYISGANIGKDEVVATGATSSTQDEGVKIEMTAPVVQRPVGSDSYVLGFVLPARFSSLEDTPVPTDPDVSLRYVPARVVAVTRYSGTWSEDNYRAHETRLLKALEGSDWRPIGEPVYARYNSPYSLWFLRRNEVMIELSG